MIPPMCMSLLNYKSKESTHNGKEYDVVSWYLHLFASSPLLMPGKTAPLLGRTTIGYHITLTFVFSVHTSSIYLYDFTHKKLHPTPPMTLWQPQYSSFSPYPIPIVSNIIYHLEKTPQEKTGECMKGFVYVTLWRRISGFGTVGCSVPFSSKIGLVVSV